jgi:hypothetical protein
MRRTQAPVQRDALNDALKRLNDKAVSQYSDEDINLVMGQGIRDLHASVLPLTIINLVYMATIVLQLIMLFRFPVPSSFWFSSFASFRLALPTIIGAVMSNYITYAYLHNLKRWVYSAHSIIIGIWFAVTLVLWVWTLVELFWWCPEKLPNYCTDGISSTLDTYYLIWAIALLIQGPLLAIELYVFSRAFYYLRRLLRGSSYSIDDLLAAIYANERFGPDYVQGIGVKYV